MDKAIFTLTPTLNSPQLAASSEPRLVYLLLEVATAPNLPLRRAPVNLTLVVDASASMRIPSLADDLVDELGRRGLLVETITDGIPVFRVLDMPDDLLERAAPVRSMDFVQEALRELVERLAPDDRFSLVAFAGHAETLVSHQTGRDKQQIVALLETLASGAFDDETYLAPGLALALQAAQSGHSGERSTRLLLLTDGFAADEAQALHAAAQLAASGFPLSTVGLGLAFNEGFLISLAEMSGGNAHLVFRPDEIQRVFASELEASQKVVLQKLDLRIALTPGVELRRAYRIKPVISELSLGALYERSLTLPLGDLEREQHISLLLALVVPPRSVGSYRLAQVVATGSVPFGQSERALVRCDVVAQVVPPDQAVAPPNPQIMRIVETVSTFRLQTRALADATAGDLAGATRKLQAAATRLLAEGEVELAETIQGEIANLAQNGQFSAAGTKKLRYETRKLTQKLD